MKIKSVMKKTLKILIAAVVVATMFTGCGLSKMVKKYDEVKYDVTPEVLQTHGRKVAVTVKGSFPEKYFHPKAVVEFTPVLKWDGGSVTLKTQKIQGEKVEGDGVVISKKTGGSFTFSDVVDYKPEMNASDLIVECMATKGNKTVSLGEVKLADGVIYTSERVAKLEDVSLAAHGYEKEVIIKKAANLYFAYNMSNYNTSLDLNRAEETKAQIKELEDFIAQNWKIKSIDINAWASPEGEESYNAELSQDRANTGEKYINDYFKNYYRKLARDRKKKVEEVEQELNINTVAKGEDFDGFMSAMQSSSIPEKQTIINVIKNQPEKSAREQEIKNMTVIYAEVEAILEVLRRAEIVISCFEPKRTDENIAMLSTTNPDSLKVEELLYAATLTNDMDTKLKIYKSCTEIYSDNWRGYNNAGYILLKQGKLAEAKTYVEKAQNLAPNQGEVLNNLGVIASWEEDFDKAKTHYESAQGQGITVNYNLGILKIREGDYAGAISLFSAKSCDYNLALAQLLSDGVDAAVKTLECCKEKTAAVHYLMAVAGARKSNLTMMTDNLKKACQLDAAYKAQAKEDREFLKYFDNADFQNAIK
jgi:Tfp pilus assembly protein PilF/outer membrane protein OmpA-like peptidoglycan-associated protein